jgi:hypothetical protein
MSMQARTMSRENSDAYVSTHTVAFCESYGSPMFRPVLALVDGACLPPAKIAPSFT